MECDRVIHGNIAELGSCYPRSSNPGKILLQHMKSDMLGFPFSCLARFPTCMISPAYELMGFSNFTQYFLSICAMVLILSSALLKRKINIKFYRAASKFCPGFSLLSLVSFLQCTVHLHLWSAFGIGIMITGYFWNKFKCHWRLLENRNKLFEEGYWKAFHN